LVKEHLQPTSRSSGQPPTHPFNGTSTPFNPSRLRVPLQQLKACSADGSLTPSCLPAIEGTPQMRGLSPHFPTLDRSNHRKKARMQHVRAPLAPVKHQALLQYLRRFFVLSLRHLSCNWRSLVGGLQPSLGQSSPGPRYSALDF